ncbi:nicotinate (nicotinamide) nucleotide adenylyltransferase [Thermoflavimicrobium daqui]|uniref:Probable nicotinate-nucleotide adenylyltransferase n=2 Tax=Thermoflavimicrobium daqui TaxID=2137476 RepID=A0A364K6W4_9BACL|nr:nicotinate (nicotinamide) nucleotide adenylyltransferase [Thermoflavimicrobium daqui]
MGGTFDPIHLGHLLIAEQAREVAGLDQVWFIPSASPPHKLNKKVTAVEHRLQMVKLAIDNHPHFHLSEIELHLPSPSYTVHTLETLYKVWPNKQFSIIIGADMVKDLPNWYKIERILELSQIIGLKRPNVLVENLPSWIATKVNWVTDRVEISLSSSYIRKQLKQGLSVRYLVPFSVEQYIKEHHLYGS